MAANTSPIFPLVIQNKSTKFTAADGTSTKTIFTAGVNGSRIDQIVGVSTDTLDRSFYIHLSDGTDLYLLGAFNIPAGSGGSVSVFGAKLLTTGVFPWLDSSGSLFLKAGWSIVLGLTAETITADTTVTFNLFGGDY